MRLGRECVLAVVLGFLLAVSPALAQHAPDSTLNWAFGGTVHTVTRAGNIVFVGGRFNAVALRRNATGGFALLSANTSHRMLPTPNVHGNVNTIVPDGAGGWFIGGNFTHIGDHRRPQLAHILPNGRLDLGWTGRVNGRVFSMTRIGGVLFVGGEFEFAGSGPGDTIPSARSNLAAFSAVDGALLPILSTGTDEPVLELSGRDTTLYVGGDFSTIQGQSRAHLAAIDVATGNVTPWNPAPDGPVRSIVPRPGNATVYIGGGFATVGANARSHVAEVDAASGLATAWNPGANATVRALFVANGNVYIGGEFTVLAATARNHLGAVDASTGLITRWDPNVDDAVNTISAAGSLVYVGGDFLTVGGRLRLHAAAIDASTGLPNQWHPAVNDPVRAILAGPRVVALGGSFEAIGGYHRRNLAAINLETGQLVPWNPRTNGPVYSLEVGGDRTLYVGGDFTVADQQSRAHLAAFRLPTLALASWNPGTDGSVRAIKSFSASSVTTVFVGGDFANAGGQVRSRLAAIDAASGSVLTSFAPGVTDAMVLALDVNGNHVYVGGRFSLLGGGSSPGLGRVDRVTGVRDGTWTPSPDGEVRAINIIGATVFAGGEFGSIAAMSRTNVAAIGTASPAAASDWQPNPDGAVNAIAVHDRIVFIGGRFRHVASLPRPRLAAVLASATGSGPYLLPWRPRWFGVVHSLHSAADGLVAGGDALPDLDDREPDPVGRVAFFPQPTVGTPAAPLDPTVEVNSGGVTVRWNPPIRGPRPQRYLLFAGATRGGSNLANGVDIGAGTSVDLPPIPAGTYYLRLRAVGATGTSRASNEVMFTAGQPTCDAPPESPIDLVASLAGRSLTLNWGPSSSAIVSGYRIEAGLSAGERAFATTVGPDAQSFSANAPAGVFYLRVVALSACGESAASNEVIVGVGDALLPPGAPGVPSASVTTGGVTIQWTAPAAGTGITGYVLEAGSGPGLGNLGSVPVSGTVVNFANVPTGTYYVRVRAINGAGVGPPSDEVVIVVP